MDESVVRVADFLKLRACLDRYEKLALQIQSENRELLDMNADIIAMSKEAVFQRDELRKEVKKLRDERDEARRELCRNEANHLPTMADPHREARRRGWNCFKEGHK
jgi:hypothetical protein